jgi:DNA-binding NtrC family response regulator
MIFMANHKLLFIDDDPDQLKVLGDYMKRLGHEVYCASSGKEGVAIWKRVRPDVTVCDLQMPEMTGIDVLNELVQHKAVVIVLTAYGDVEAAVEAMRCGAENFLTKPVDMPHLTQALDKAAEKTRLRQQTADLRARLRPSLRKRVVKLCGVVVLIGAAVILGQWIGRGPEEGPTAYIPVPIDTTPNDSSPR